MSAPPKSVREWSRFLRDLSRETGWTVERRRGHYVFTPPPGAVRPDGSPAHQIVTVVLRVRHPLLEELPTGPPAPGDND